MGTKIREHSLSIVLLLLMAGYLAGAIYKGVAMADVLSNLFGDTYGALVIVLATKWFKERGSVESK